MRRFWGPRVEKLERILINKIIMMYSLNWMKEYLNKLHQSP